MNIRKFETKDKAAVVNLWQRVFPDHPPHNEPAAMIDAKLAVDDLIFVVKFQNQIVGACMAGYDGHRGWLYAVGVDSEYRRKGIGAQLVKYAMQALKQIGCTKVNLQIRTTNTAVAAFYQSLGFKTEQRLSMGAFIG